MTTAKAAQGGGHRRRSRRKLAVTRARVVFAEFSPRSQRVLSILAGMACVALAIYLGVRHSGEAGVQRAANLVVGGEYRKAITEAESVRDFPAVRDALLIRAEADAALGGAGQAAAAMQQAVRLDPENAAFRYDLAVDLLNAGRRRAARSQMAWAITLDPKLVVPAAFGSVRGIAR